MNRKVKKAALKSALSVRYRDEQMIVLDALQLAEISTKGFVEVLKRFDLSKALVVVDGDSRNVELSARNLPNVKVLQAEGVNVYDVMKYPRLVLTAGAVDQIEGVLNK